MADIIEVNMSNLQRDVNEMKEVLQKIQSEMAGMFEAVEELDAQWKGTAKDRFRTVFMKDKEDFEELCKYLGDILESYSESVQVYRKCESDVMERINKIKI